MGEPFDGPASDRLDGRAGIRAIAAEAGVAIATVSRVLNRTANLQSRLRQPVLEAAARLDARPNGVAPAAAQLVLEPRPDAVLVANHLITLGARRILLRGDVPIPRDHTVIGFDVACVDVVRPALTVVAQPIDELGEHAIALLLACVSGQRTEPRPEIQVLPARLIVRGSS